MTENLPIETSPKFPKKYPPHWWGSDRVIAAYTLANPENKDKTKEELAKIIGVDRKTLWSYERKPWFIEAVNVIRKKHLAGKFPAICNTISRFAEAGDPRHIKIFLDLIGESPEQKGMQVNIQSAETKILIIRPSGEKVEMK